jgi:hypothetical protein
MRLHTAHGSVIKTGRADQTSKKIAREIRGAGSRVKPDRCWRSRARWRSGGPTARRGRARSERCG